MLKRALVVCAAWVLCAPAAHAAALPPCTNSATIPNPVIVQAGDTQKTLMYALGAKLRAATPPITLVLKFTGSCTNLQRIYSNMPYSENLLYIPAAGTTSWDGKSDPPTSCDGTGLTADVANSISFLDQCPTAGTQPANVKAYRGPVQGMVFAVPPGSDQVAITAEEAYFVFGWPNGDGMVTPWNNDMLKFVRPITKGTMITIGANIQVPVTKWHGQQIDMSGAVLNDIAGAADAEHTIGILGTEVYDANRQKVKGLAFQWFQQHGAYYPDSTSTSFDKQNLRDGHYAIWSYTWWLTQVDTAGSIVKANVKTFMDAVTGTSQLDTVIGSKLIPLCAMKVQRSAEGGPLSLYSPSTDGITPCGCYYESKLGTASASCVACTGDAMCGTGQKCSNGFCEVSQ